MSKYGDLIKEARKANQPADKAGKGQKAQQQELKISSILESQNPSIPETSPEVKLAGISIKVPEHLRRHWVVESKRKGKSMTSVIIEALTREFGEPERGR